MKLIFKNRISVIISLYMLALLFWNLLLFLNPDKTTPLNYWFNAGYGAMFFAAGIAGIVYAKQIGLSSIIGKALSFIGGGLLSYSIAQFIWLFYNLFSSIEVPYPSIADIFFLLFYVLVFIGFISLVNIFKQSVTKSIVIQSVILLPIVLALSLVFVFKPDLSSNLSFLGKVLNILYPVCDALVLYIILITLRVSGGYFKSTIWFFSVAGTVLLLGDFLFTYRNSQETYWNGDISDIVFLLSAYLFFLSFIYFKQKIIEITPQL